MNSIEFEDFWTKLTAHEIWFDQLKMRFFRRDMRSVANECYLFLLASGNRWAAQDYDDFRRCYLNFLKNAKDAQVAPTLQQEEKKPEDSSEPILTGEARQQRINEWLSLVQQAPIMKPVQQISYKEIADEGDWLPKKPAPYPSCSESEVKKRLLHIEYVRENYDSRTSDPLPTWMSEDDWLKSKNT